MEKTIFRGVRKPATLCFSFFGFCRDHVGQIRMRNSFRRQETDWFRNMVELSILFVIAVMMLRGFALEGYLISTGSMAPGLLGLHKRVECPSCRRPFAFGVSFDESVRRNVNPGAALARDYATCPNCGQTNIAVAQVPVNHGDQLLVQKGVFDFRRPRRWETVVFRNPADPGEAYVKRVVGLPGETLQIIDGDLYIEGEIARKDYETAKDARIPVFNAQYSAGAEQWQSPWHCTGTWKPTETGMFEVARTEHSPDETETKFHWLQFRNWRWTGGTHVVEVPLQNEAAQSDWQVCLKKLANRPVTWITRLRFDAERQVLRLRGVMPYDMQEDLVSWAATEELRTAFYRLGALSHLCPVTDIYGYNSGIGSSEYPVRDLMLRVSARFHEPQAVLAVTMPVDNRVYRVEVNSSHGLVALYAEGETRPLRTAELTPQSADATHQVDLEFANFDHRLIVAVDGMQVFAEVDLPIGQALHDSDLQQDPVAWAKRTAEVVTQQSRLAIGVQGGPAELTNLELYRDVYYTPGRRQNGVDEPVTIATNTYFVQGDNSPVSSDSRNWKQPFVPHRLLVGKPFIVHLPSQPGKLTIGGIELPIRIPDLERIRYIR